MTGVQKCPFQVNPPIVAVTPPARRLLCATLTRLLASLLALSAAASCTCQGKKLQSVNLVTLTFTAPTDGADLAPDAKGHVAVTVDAADPAGLGKVSLLLSGATASQTLLSSCDAKGAATLTCVGDADLTQVHPDAAGIFTFTAIATDNAGVPTTVSIHAHLGHPTVAITQPAAAGTPPVAKVSGLVTLAAKASGPMPIAQVDFLLDTLPLATAASATAGVWSPPPLSLAAHGTGAHKLVATATDLAGQQASASEDLVIACAADADCASGEVCCAGDVACHKPTTLVGTCDCAHPCSASISFVSPASGAMVGGAATLSAKVVDNQPVARVDFLLDGKMVATVSGPDANGNFTAPGVALGAGGGMHVLSAISTDAATKTARVDEPVSLGCAADADCAGGGRCCAMDASCHATVGDQALCDCAHPCGAGEGCLAGTCGEAARCRAGCFPGTDSQPSDTCGANLYCSSLPAAQATAQNKGGACAPGDGCSVANQDCASYPLDRGSAIDASTNPSTPSTCEPVGIRANVCYPAGPLRLGAGCGVDGCLPAVAKLAEACSKGLLCVTPVDSNYNPIAPASCQPFCQFDTSSNSPFQDGCDSTRKLCCPTGEYCSQLLGAGHVPLPFGACGTMLCQACFQDSDCGPSEWCVTDPKTYAAVCAAPPNNGVCPSGQAATSLDDGGLFSFSSHTVCFWSSGSCP